jgi:hypothetical protein
MNIIWKIDALLIRAVKWLRGMFTGWLGMDNREFELLLWATFVSLRVLYILQYGQAWLETAGDIFAALCMYAVTTVPGGFPGTYRSMFGRGAIIGFYLRCFLVGDLVGVSIFRMMSVQVRGEWLDLSATLVYTIWVFSLSIDGDDDPPGKKRKIALAKLKELFGTGWMPTPVSTPQ